MKRKLSGLFLLVLLVFSAGCSVKSKEQYQAELLEGDQAVTIEIRCDTILSNTDKLREEIAPLIPEDGVLLAKTEAGVPEKATAYDLLIKAAKAEELVINLTGSGTSAYIASINGIGEYDCGELSGWMFFVNGERPSMGCGSYELSEGDEVAFRYTCDLGDDLE